MAVGDHVDRDQIVAVVETDKAEVELRAFQPGTISAVGGEVGDVLAVGAVLLELVPDGATAPVPPIACAPPHNRRQ